MEVIIMRIQHNIMALNSNRQLGINNSAVARSLEKLSSGYRINRAGDDAAGLAISEKMRAQIKGLEAATDNSQDAISLVQTAEGGLQEVHSMLNRMTELATKSANGTYTDDVDRKALQDEISALKDEINRIADGTDFNGIKLLDGTMGAGTAGAIGAGTDGATKLVAATNFTFTAPSGCKLDIKVDGGAADSSASWTGDTLTITLKKDTAFTQADLDNLVSRASGTPTSFVGKVKVEAEKAFSTGATGGASIFAAPIESKATKPASVTATNITVTSKKAGNDTSKITFQSGTAGTTAGAINGADGNAVVTLEDSKAYSASDINAMLSNAGVEKTVSFDGTIKGADFATKGVAGNGVFTLAGGEGLAADGGLTLQIGDTSEVYNQLELSIADMHVGALGIDGVDISTRDGAAAAMSKIKTAINTVSTSRGKLGAIQNRLEHTINNLGVTTENITSAESRIRDVDMAKEMMNYTKNSVLVQSAQAMLAQANQQPQSVLQLLQ